VPSQQRPPGPWRHHWKGHQRYARDVGPFAALAAAVALLIGLPLLIVGLAAVGLAGWIAAAVVLPLATLGVILWLGRARPGDGEPPGTD
jgi:hypothetical protein